MWLIHEQRHDHDRHASGESTERRPRTAVRRDDGRICEHSRLLDPSLDVHVVRGGGPSNSGIKAVSDGEQHTSVQ